MAVTIDPNTPAGELVHSLAATLPSERIPPESWQSPRWPNTNRPEPGWLGVLLQPQKSTARRASTSAAVIVPDRLTHSTSAWAPSPSGP